MLGRTAGVGLGRGGGGRGLGVDRLEQPSAVCKEKAKKTTSTVKEIFRQLDRPGDDEGDDILFRELEMRPRRLGVEEHLPE